MYIMIVLTGLYYVMRLFIDEKLEIKENTKNIIGGPEIFSLRPIIWRTNRNERIHQYYE